MFLVCVLGPGYRRDNGYFKRSRTLRLGKIGELTREFTGVKGGELARGFGLRDRYVEVAVSVMSNFAEALSVVGLRSWCSLAIPTVTQER